MGLVANALQGLKARADIESYTNKPVPRPEPE